MNILLVNPGRRDYLIKYFLKFTKKFNLKIFLIDPDKNIPSFAVSNKTFNYICPAVKYKKKFKNFLRNFTRKHNIKVIFPISENELQILANEKDFYKKRGIDVIVSESAIIKICNNKLLTNNFLLNYNILSPKIITFKNIRKNLPVIKKSVFGSGSKNQFIIKSTKEIPKQIDKKYFFQKYHKFEEYGMDILNDLKGNFIHCCVKKKLLMRAGETDKAEIINSKKFVNFAKRISSALKHVGVLEIDFLYNNKKIYILDLNPRIGGGYPFTHLAGFNYLLALVRMSLKKKIYLSRKPKLITCMKGISLHYYNND